jgi:hypothetical protein
VDLRPNLYYGGGNGGEGRFVFEMVSDPNGSCTPLPFTVIFEYGVPAATCSDVRYYAAQWLMLSRFTPGTEEFNDRLQRITERFVPAGAAPGRPFGLALNQVRTNEVALGEPWELREFTVGPDGFLALSTVKQTPDDSQNRSERIAEYVNSNAAAILDGSHDVPDAFPPSGAHFVGGVSHVTRPSEGFFWNGPPAPGTAIGNPEARHRFSLATCNGCHGGESGTQFQHIGSLLPSAPGQAGLSGFLTGITVADPSGNGTTRVFNDLLRRAQDLEALVNTECIEQIDFRPLFPFPH